ncbi:MAG: winged helix-turn-helix domain-containing protein [Xanthomonadales bacterium]|jgi:DNA-binding winged helix-turn-helix (wHTH) protein/tetratricopeptide (TPR) repeat protein|nr:winged helix-turn-helix domain-containing protein [Xanthomonadales bacterium]
MRYRFLDFEVDTDRELLIGPTGSVALRRQAWRMLVYLIGRAPAVVTRDELMDALWGHHALSPNVIPQTISELRQALADDAQESRCIETRHRRGYAFIAPITVVPGDDPVASIEPSAPSAATELPVIPGLLPDVPQPVVAQSDAPQQAATLPTVPQADVSQSAVPHTTERQANFASIRPSFRRLLPWTIAALAVLLVGVAIAWRPPAPVPALADRSPVALPSSRPQLQLALADPALAAYLRLLGQSGADWVALAADAPLPAGAQRLLLDAEGHWRLLDAGGALQLQGQLPAATVPARASLLLHGIGLAAAATPTGWPMDADAQSALAEAAWAAEQGDLGHALAACARASASGLQGWAGYFQVELLQRSGDAPAALARLATLDPAGDRPLRLLLEATRAALEGRPADQLAALGAYGLLLPEALDRRLQLLDLQLSRGQWSAAAASLDDLSLSLGEDAPALAWRRAQWLAAVQPGEAGKAFAWAVSQAAARGEAPRLREARLAAARWHLRHTRHAEAAALLAELEAGDPTARELAAQLDRERGALEAADATLAALAREQQSRGWQGEARRIEAARIEVQLQRGDAAGARTAAEALLTVPDTAVDPLQRVVVLMLAGRALSGLGDFEAALAHLQEAVTLAGARGEGLQEAQARYQLGNVLAMQRLRKAEAGQAWQLAAEAFARAGDRRGEAQALANLALLAQQQGRLLDARIGYQGALEQLSVLGLPREHGRVRLNLAVTERDLGELRSAAQHLDAALELLADAGATDLRVAASAARADVALMMAEPAIAEAALTAVVELRRMAVPLAQSTWLTASARRAQLSGDVDSAAGQLLAAQTLREQANIEVALLDLRLQQLRLGLSSAAAAAGALLALEDIEARLTRLGEAKYALAAGLAVAEAHIVAGNPTAARRKLELLQAPAQQHGSRAQQLQLDWLRAWIEAPELRGVRLRAVADAASNAGFTLLARLAEHAQWAEGSPQRAELEAAFRADRLSGALASPAFAF